MVPVHSKDMEKTIADGIVSLTQQFHGQDRALLFCWSHDECDRMATLLGWRPYHESISLQEHSESMKMWVNGDILGLVCTLMLNCCLDYPLVRIVFHLGPPRDAMDYYPAIGRVARQSNIGQAITYFDPTRLKKVDGEDPFGASVIYDMLRDNTRCRRLRPVIFLDGFAIPCVMLPGAQLCDVCECEAACAPPETGPVRFPDYLLPLYKCSNPAPIKAHIPSKQQPKFLTPTPADLISNHAFPLANIRNHVAPTQATLNLPEYSEVCGLEVYLACEVLVKSCVCCWSQGLDHHSHTLPGCPFNGANETHQEWKNWGKTIRLPPGCCFYCGCPLKVCLLESCTGAGCLMNLVKDDIFI
jgi:hypothetical protein